MNRHLPHTAVTIVQWIYFPECPIVEGHVHQLVELRHSGHTDICTYRKDTYSRISAQEYLHFMEGLTLLNFCFCFVYILTSLRVIT